MTGPGDTDLAAVAALIGDPARARILLALCGGDGLSAGALAGHAGLSAQATSAHLAKLRDAGLVTVTPSGRFRHYRLAGRDVVAALEALARLAPARPVRSLREERRARSLRSARICFDHLAGRLGVLVADGLVARRAIVPSSPDPIGDVVWTAGDGAGAVFDALGVPGRLVPAHAPLYPCLDWSAGRPHLSGPPGTALLQGMLDGGLLDRLPGGRAVRLSARGRRRLHAVLGLDV